MKAIALIISIVTLLLTSGVAYAAKPEVIKGKAYGQLETKELKMEQKALAKSERVKPLQKFYCYPLNTDVEALYNYEEAPWAMVRVNNKQMTVSLIGHNLTADAEYTLSISGGDQVVATANEEGVVHFKKVALTAVPVTAEDISFDDMTCLDIRLKSDEIEEETEEVEEIESTEDQE